MGKVNYQLDNLFGEEIIIKTPCPNCGEVIGPHSVRKSFIEGCSLFCSNCDEKYGVTFLLEKQRAEEA